MPRKIDRRWFSLLVAAVVALALVPVFAVQDDRPALQPNDGQRQRVQRVPNQRATEPARVLVLTGQNNHDWERTTPLIVGILEDAGDRFDIDTSTSPAGGADDAGWADWRPRFTDYDVVVSDYNGQMWPAEVREAFEAYVDGGGKVLILHAANNAFTGWTEYEQMTGLLWRNADFGARVYINDEGETVRVPAGEGPGAGHGPQYDWPITHREDHAIFDGLPTTWMHARDELYHGQRGPAEDMTILATAYSTTGGTGEHEPMLWTIPYGDGTAMTFLPGHLWRGQDNTEAFRCVGYRTLLQRACEWLATGEVTVPVPDDFPTAGQRSVVPE